MRKSRIILSVIVVVVVALIIVFQTRNDDSHELPDQGTPSESSNRLHGSSSKDSGSATDNNDQKHTLQETSSTNESDEQQADSESVRLVCDVRPASMGYRPPSHRKETEQFKFSLTVVDQGGITLFDEVGVSDLVELYVPGESAVGVTLIASSEGYQNVEYEVTKRDRPKAGEYSVEIVLPFLDATLSVDLSVVHGRGNEAFGVVLRPYESGPVWTDDNVEEFDTTRSHTYEDVTPGAYILKIVYKSSIVVSGSKTVSTWQRLVGPFMLSLAPGESKSLSFVAPPLGSISGTFANDDFGTNVSLRVRDETSLSGGLSIGADVNASFTVENVLPGRYQVEITDGDRIYNEEVVVTVRTDATVGPISLDRSLTDLKVTVLDDEGNRFEGARVFARCLSRVNQFGRPVSFHSESDERGVATFRSLPPGFYTVGSYPVLQVYEGPPPTGTDLGDALKLSGRAPATIVLGDKPAVSLELARDPESAQREPEFNETESYSITPPSVTPNATYRIFNAMRTSTLRAHSEQDWLDVSLRRMNRYYAIPADLDRDAVLRALPQVVNSFLVDTHTFSPIETQSVEWVEHSVSVPSDPEDSPDRVRLELLALGPWGTEVVFRRTNDLDYSVASFGYLPITDGMIARVSAYKGGDMIVSRDFPSTAARAGAFRLAAAKRENSASAKVTVVDEYGNAMPGAFVDLIPFSGGATTETLTEVAQVDGVAHLDGLEGGRDYLVQVRFATLVHHSSLLRLEPGQNRITVEFRYNSGIEIELSELQTRAAVEVWSDNNELVAYQQYASTSNAFLVPGPGVYTVSVHTFAGMEERRIRIGYGESQRVKFDITLPD